MRHLRRARRAPQQPSTPAAAPSLRQPKSLAQQQIRDGLQGREGGGSLGETLDAVAQRQTDNGWSGESQTGEGFRWGGRLGDAGLREEMLGEAGFMGTTVANGDAAWSQPTGMDWADQWADHGGLNGVALDVPGGDSERPFEDVGQSISEVVGSRLPNGPFSEARWNEDGEVELVEEDIQFGETAE